MSERIYISGKMGEAVISEATKEKFAEAEKMLKKYGWTVVNPASDSYQKGLRREVRLRQKAWEKGFIGDMPFNEYTSMLLYDIHCISICDAIYMLRDWTDSLGARVEHAFAVACGKTIKYQE